MELPSQKKQRNKEIGAYGEQIATNYLINKGFEILSRNYLKKWGEIDIVARRTDTIHFIEVKTVSYETKDQLHYAVSRGTWRPEENVHPWKIRKLHRAIESWLMEKAPRADWQIDVISIRLVPRERYATVVYLDNIVL